MSGATLRYEVHATPVVSIVIVLWNRAELTLRCLRAIGQHPDLPVELILVDNHSTDETSALLTKIVGATIIRNDSNLGFTCGANLGARAARGHFLLFLNNDAEMMPGALEELLRTMTRSPAVGAVGGKLVFPDGRLQEAGSIIWSDGSCEAYGRNGNPEGSEFGFQRDVDFCSGAFLLTSRELFWELGGFDERYQPAYYEDVDYCVKVWKSGHRVVYQPAAAAIHFEFASSTSRSRALALQQAHKSVFLSLHGPWLSGQLSRSDGVLSARSRRRGARSVLVIEDSWPEPQLGSGFARTAAMLRALVDLDYLVTFYPMSGVARDVVPADRLAEVEVVGNGGLGNLRAFLKSQHGWDAVVVSRPHNLQHVKAAVGRDLSELGAPLVYDAEAVYALREIARRRLSERLSCNEERVLLERELTLARGCAVVIAVNEIERQTFLEAGISNVVVLGHALAPVPTAATFESRRGLLFVGALAPDSPNEDTVLFLIREVLPALKLTARQRMPLVVVGASVSDRVKTLATDDIRVLDNVRDLTPWYASARVFVAPARFAAGIPLKLYEAAAHGVPIVCTGELARQLGWRSEQDLITGETPSEIARAINRVHSEPELWQELREAALNRVARDCAPALFSDRLREAIEPCFVQ